MSAPGVNAFLQRRFDKFVGLLAAAMGHADRLTPLHQYCTGLLLPGQRKSIEPIAAMVAPHQVRNKHRSLVHFIADAPWDDDDVLCAVREWVLPALIRASKELFWIVDDTGIVKKGTLSVGVGRQYCGQVGKRENCQVAVSLSISNDCGSLPIAYRLYLPEDWANDRARRRTAKVPEEVEFQTKLQIALTQITEAVQASTPQGVVLADAGYGNDSKFRKGVSDLGLTYCVGIHSTTTVWPPELRPVPVPVKEKGSPGRPRSLLRRSPGHEPLSVEKFALSLPPEKFSSVVWREGAKGEMASRFVACRVIPAHLDFKKSQLRPEEWLLIEWPTGESKPTKYFFSTLTADTPLERLVRIAKERHHIERDYLELKDEIGLDHYEGRGWRGFHHHATLCIAAYAFLMKERLFFPSDDLASDTRIAAPEIPKGYRPRGSASSA